MAPPSPTTSTPGKIPPNYDTRGPNIVACAVILLIVPSITVAIRLWSRTVASRARFWWDDFMLLSTLLFSHLYLIMNLWGVALGLGKHQWMVPMDSLKSNLMMLHLGLTFYNTAITLMKLSALTLYARLFRVSTKALLHFRVMGAFILAFWVVIIVVPWTNCTPLRKTIDPFLKGSCTTRIHYYLTAGALNVILDFIILLTPMPIIWRLNLRWKRKVMITLVFFFGYCSAFLSLTRLIIIAKRPAILSAAPGSDPSWDTVPMLYVSMLEAPFGVVALCGPPIHQIFQRYRSFGWRSLLSTREYPSHSGSDKTPSLDHVQATGNSRFAKAVRKKSSKATVSSKTYIQMEGEEQAVESPQPKSLKSGANDTPEELELKFLTERGTEFL